MEEKLQVRVVFYYYLFFQIAKQEKFKNNPKKYSNSYIELAEMFFKFYGISLNNYFSLLFSIYSNYSTNIVEISPFTNIYTNLYEYLKQTNIKEDEISIFIDKFTLSIENFKEYYENDSSQSIGQRTLNFTVLSKYPILRNTINEIICFAPQLLEEAMSTGLYWKLYDCLINEDRKHYPIFFGHIFEDCICYLLQLHFQSYKRERMIVPEKFFYIKSASDQPEITDFIIQNENIFIYLDAKSARYKLETKTSKLSEDDIYYNGPRKLDKIFKGIKLM